MLSHSSVYCNASVHLSSVPPCPEPAVANLAIVASPTLLDGCPSVMESPSSMFDSQCHYNRHMELAPESACEGMSVSTGIQASLIYVKAHLSTAPDLLCQSSSANAAKSIVGGKLLFLCAWTTAGFSPATCVDTCPSYSHQSPGLQARWTSCNHGGKRALKCHIIRNVPQLLTTVLISTHKVQAC